MNGNCSRWEQCEAVKKLKGCFGCPYQHFEQLLNAHPNDKFLKDVADKLFNASSKRTKPGGRIDKPIREEIAQLFMKELKEFKIRQLPSKELKGEIANIGEKLKIKSDGAFQAQTGGKTIYIFYEVKGYGDNSNDVLSAITAAQLVKEMTKFESSLYYYIGVNSSMAKSGFTRKLLSKGIEPYVEWAESKKFLWFYGIVEVNELLTDIRKRLTSGK